MSRYGWEQGTIKLPSSAVAGIKRELQEHSIEFRNDVRAEVVRLHNSVGEGTRSTKVYRDRLTSAKDRFDVQMNQRGYFAYDPARGRYGETVTATAYRILEDMLETVEKNGNAVRKPTAAEMDQFVPVVNTRTTSFWPRDPQGYIQSSITFDGTSVTWSVDDNNHSVESAHCSPLTQLFFRLLEQVKWTRGSGGTIVGNDEYNQDSDQPGGGANYVVRTYGS